MADKLRASLGCMAKLSEGERDTSITEMAQHLRVHAAVTEFNPQDSSNSSSRGSKVSALPTFALMCAQNLK